MKRKIKIEKLDFLRDKIEKDLVCDLKLSATNMVFGKGNVDAEIFFIGEAPGEKEDLCGLPFVGRAGKELDLLLEKIGLRIDDIYIANILKYRPPKNRNPSSLEIKSHTPFLIEQIKIVNPKIIVTLGNYSTRFVLSNFNLKFMSHVDSISNLRGEFKSVKLDDDLEFFVFPLYHPAAMLYNPKLREVMVEDFKKLGDFLKKI